MFVNLFGELDRYWLIFTGDWFFSLSDRILDEVCHFLEEIQFQGLLLLVGQVLSIFEMLFHLLRLYLPGHFSVLGPQRVPHRGWLI